MEEGRKKYYYILDNDTFQLVLWPTKYLKYKVDVERSPNTVKRFALSLSYYLQYLSETELELAEVSRLGFEDQSNAFRPIPVLAQGRPSCGYKANREYQKC